MNNPRLIKHEELNELLDLYTHLFEEDLPAPSKVVLEKIWDDIMADEKIRYFVIEHEGILAACCHIVIVPNLTRGGASYGLIENVVTAKKFRRRGYGHKVLNAAVQYAREKGCYKVMLLTSRMNDHIDNFYKSAGFESGKKQAYVISFKEDLISNAP